MEKHEEGEEEDGSKHIRYVKTETEMVNQGPFSGNNTSNFNYPSYGSYGYNPHMIQMNSPRGHPNSNQNRKTQHDFSSKLLIGNSSNGLMFEDYYQGEVG